ncbi:MAG: YcxB family protein [Clostridia bacterium]|nr:YcxB family protein [Clostridia bacterium]
MNEPLFKNRFVRDENSIKEMYRNVFFSLTRLRPLIIFAAIISLFLLLSHIFKDSFGKPTPIYICIFVLIGLVAGTVINYRRSVKISVQREKELDSNGHIAQELSVFDDRITLQARGNTLSIQFENIKCFIITNNYIYVVSKGQIWYDLKKDSFTLGSAEEFIEFLRSKGIKEQK